MITFRHRGDYSKATRYLERLKEIAKLSQFDKYGQEGVAALSAATPIDSGLTANSWYYNIVHEGDRITIEFHNTNINEGVPSAVILQYGHGTGTGGWVEGRDYINPAIQPIFDKIVNEAWKEVTKL